MVFKHAFPAIPRHGLALTLLLAGLAWAGEVPAQSRLRVVSVVVEKASLAPRLTFTQPALTLLPGDTVANPARSDQAGSNGEIAYRSGDESIARVAANGEVTAVAPGATTITATQAADPPGYEAGAGACEVTVSAPLSADATVATASWQVGDEIGDGIMPVAAAGGIGPLRYAIAPALPANLSLDEASGRLTGKPSASSPMTAYTVTVTDSANPPHSANAGFTLSINEALASSRLIASRNFRLTDNAAITPMAVTGGVGRIRYTVAPALPAGVTLGADDGVLTAAPTEKSARASYTLVATDSGSPPHTVSETIDLAVFGAVSTFANPGSTFTGTCSAAKGWSVKVHLEAPGKQAMTLYAGADGNRAVAYDRRGTDEHGNRTWTGTPQQVREGLDAWGTMLIKADVFEGAVFQGSSKPIKCTR